MDKYFPPVLCNIIHQYLNDFPTDILLKMPNCQYYHWQGEKLEFDKTFADLEDQKYLAFSE